MFREVAASFQPRRARGFTKRLAIPAVVFLLASHGPAAFCCTIPVFRFALDRWEPDRLRLVVPADAARRPDLARLLLPLRGNGIANLRIEERGPAGSSDAVLSEAREGGRALWSGSLSAEGLALVLDSPARRELLRRILAGDSVVWVIAGNGSLASAAGAERVEKRLRYLEQVVALPRQDPTDPDSRLGPGPALKLRFSALRIGMNDPAERLLCAMLAGEKCAGAMERGESFAAPVFGRGRVLGSFVLEELDDTTLEDATLFLTGRCSCRVKTQSPGWDLLLQVDWESALQRVQREQEGGPVPEAGRAAAPEAVRIQPRKP